MNKEKRQVKSKEQITAELKSQEELARKRKKVKEVFYPFLLERSESIEDARILCSALSIAIDQAFMQKKRTTELKDLKLVDMLNETEQSDRWKKLLEMFEEENIFDVLEMINQFPNEMDFWIRKEMQDRKLESLKMELLD